MLRMRLKFTAEERRKGECSCGAVACCACVFDGTAKTQRREAYSVNWGQRLAGDHLMYIRDKRYMFFAGMPSMVTLQATLSGSGCCVCLPLL